MEEEYNPTNYNHDDVTDMSIEPYDPTNPSFYNYDTRELENIKRNLSDARKKIIEYNKRIESIMNLKKDQHVSEMKEMSEISEMEEKDLQLLHEDRKLYILETLRLEDLLLTFSNKSKDKVANDKVVRNIHRKETSVKRNNIRNPIVTRLELDKDEEVGPIRNPNVLKFNIKGVDEAFVNALKRTMTEDVPTLAIDKVEIYKNTSVLYDQMLVVQRLSFISINSENVDQFVYADECLCKNTSIDSYCKKCSVAFQINVKNTSKEVRVVTDRDFECDCEEDRKYIEFPNQPGLPPLPIVELGHQQEIHLKAIVRKGRGSLHAKWSPIVKCHFNAIPKVRLDQNLLKTWSRQEKQAIVESCPKKVFFLKMGDDDLVDVEDSGRKCTRCEECLKCTNQVLKKPIQAISLSELKSTFVFFIETSEQRKPMDVLKAAIKILVQDLQTVSYLLKN